VKLYNHTYIYNIVSYYAMVLTIRIVLLLLLSV